MRKTNEAYATDHERQIDMAMSRLNLHGGFLSLAKGRHYGGNISDDIQTVLKELHQFRLIEEPASPLPLGKTEAR